MSKNIPYKKFSKKDSKRVSGLPSYQRKGDYRSLINKKDSTSFFGKILANFKAKPKPAEPKLGIKTQQRIEKEKLNQIPVKKKSRLSQAFFGFIKYIFIAPIILIFTPFRKMGQVSIGVLSVRNNYIKIAFIVVFLGIIFRFGQLQLIGANSNLSLKNSNSSIGEIVLARRGLIFIQDLSQNKVNIPVTSSQLQIDIFVDAKNLQQLMEKGLVLNDMVIELSGRINLPLKELYDKIKTEVSKENPTSNLVIGKDITEEQKNSVLYLRTGDLNKKFNFQFWLGLNEKQTRSYPQNKLLASTIGYVPPFSVPESEILTNLRSCQDMVEENTFRQTSTKEYMVGFYGLEQKYCSELGGLNGLRKFGFSDTNSEKNVQNGADLYLTIDQNLQVRAEQILQNAVKENTNTNGAPVDGAVVVMEVKTGKIRAMASYPGYDPNDYQKYWAENPASFRNVATNVSYDTGSVLKPITIAAALNTFQSGFTENGVRKGVDPSFTFKDYNKKGKPYTELDGTTYYIQNANGISYQQYGSLGLKEITRDSINTGIADIVDKTGARKLKEYYEEQFKFGQQTAIALPGDSTGNITSFTKDINCPICYANFGFGQGFNISPIQLMRAYTAIANNGFLVEPYLVEKIAYKDGLTDDGSSPSSKIPRKKQQQVITPTTAKLVTAYMQAVVEEGYLGEKKSLAAVPGYQIAGKSGTAEINRPYIKTDSQGKPVLDEKNQPVMVPCDYSCNRKRGHYDHTFVGFGPIKDPKYIVLVKLGEPNPGQVRNFSSDTVGKPFSLMMEYSLNYAGIPKDF